MAREESEIEEVARRMVRDARHAEVLRREWDSWVVQICDLCEGTGADRAPTRLLAVLLAGAELIRLRAEVAELKGKLAGLP